MHVCICTHMHVHIVCVCVCVPRAARHQQWDLLSRFWSGTRGPVVAGLAPQAVRGPAQAPLQVAARILGAPDLAPSPSPHDVHPVCTSASSSPLYQGPVMWTEGPSLTTPFSPAHPQGPFPDEVLGAGGAMQFITDPGEAHLPASGHPLWGAGLLGRSRHRGDAGPSSPSKGPGGKAAGTEPPQPRGPGPRTEEGAGGPGPTARRSSPTPLPGPAWGQLLGALAGVWTLHYPPALGRRGPGGVGFQSPALTSSAAVKQRPGHASRLLPDISSSSDTYAAAPVP